AAPPGRPEVGPGRVDEPPPGVLRLGAAALRASPGRVRRHLLRAERPVGGAASAPGWAARARAVRSRPPSAWPPTGWPHTASSRPVWANGFQIAQETQRWDQRIQRRPVDN
ncbi:unnamed protein product, partial [Prorocentrum cordatum]